MHCIIVFCVTRRVNITLSLGLMMMMMTMIMIMMILHMRIDELEGQFSVQFELAGVNSSIIINTIFKKGKYNPRCCCSIVVNFENFKIFVLREFLAGRK